MRSPARILGASALLLAAVGAVREALRGCFRTAARPYFWNFWLAWNSWLAAPAR